MEHPHIGGLSEWRPIARGSLAVVWEARQLSLGRPVAVKVYHRELDKEGRRRFLREAATAGQLSGHPGVVTVHDAGILTDDRPYLIMELCPGGSLTRWLRPDNRATEGRIRDVGVRIADALAAVHRSGLLHRDVKPANILIDHYDNPGLAGFGLAAVAGDDTAATDGLPVTPAYAPPEAFAMQPATESGDVYSLAATMYALLSGHPPRSGGIEPTAAEPTVEVTTAPVRSIPGVNWCLMDILMAALSQDPSARPTAASFRDRLAELPVVLSKRPVLVGAAQVGSSTVALVPPADPGPLSLAAGRPGVADSPTTVEPLQPPDGEAPALSPRSRGKRRVVMAAVAAALVAVVASGTTWLINEPAPSSVTAPVQPSTAPGQPSSTAASSPEPEPSSATAPTTGSTISLADPVDSAKPFETVAIEGTYSGAPDTLLQIERWEAGVWVAYPVLAKTDESGEFTAYVELGKPGRYRLRVRDPDSGMTSEAFVLVIAG